jgi:hypothetical protein
MCNEFANIIHTILSRSDKTLDHVTDHMTEKNDPN